MESCCLPEDAEVTLEMSRGSWLSGAALQQAIRAPRSCPGAEAFGSREGKGRDPTAEEFSSRDHNN